HALRYDSVGEPRALQMEDSRALLREHHPLEEIPVALTGTTGTRPDLCRVRPTQSRTLSSDTGASPEPGQGGEGNARLPKVLRRGDPSTGSQRSAYSCGPRG